MTDIPFFRPAIGEEEIAEVVACLRSGWLTTGAKTRAFEAAFAEALGGGVEAVAVNSATAALHLALEAAGVGAGDAVICPSLTFTATAEVIRYLGADPVFVDSDPETLNLTVEGVAAALTPRTRAAMAVHFAGRACDMTGLGALARRHGLALVDDAAHALPTAHRGTPIGAAASGATATAFSFYANKTITTGEGGMLTTPNPEIAARARKMRLHGIDRDVFDRFTATRAPWLYDVVAPGFKYNLTDIAAAIGLHQLAKSERFAAARARLAARYAAAIAPLPVILPPGPAEGDRHSWHLFILRVTEAAPLDRDSLIAQLKEAGIGCSVHYTPLHRMTYWRERYGLRAEDFPGAEAIYRGCLSLPLYPTMTEAEQDRVIETLHRLLG